MRQIILDTETTGLEPGQGHRIIEFAGVEIINRRLTGRCFHRYLNPGRDSDEAALRIHGLTREFLSDKPKFPDVVDELWDFLRGAELLIHNAAFDVSFIDHELSLVNRGAIRACCRSITDTLKLARELHPGKRNSLDALCARYSINNSARTLHGALLDAQLLAEVYLAMTRGQESLIAGNELLDITVHAVKSPLGPRPLLVISADPDELKAHEMCVAEMDAAAGPTSLWARSIEAPKVARAREVAGHFGC